MKSSPSSKQVIPRQGSYNSIKEQLQIENLDLMKERAQLENQKEQKNLHPRSHRKYQRVHTEKSAIAQEEDYNDTLKTSPRDQTANMIKSKIREIIMICNAQANRPNSTNFHGVLEAEQQIMKYLDNFNPSSSLDSPRKNKDMKNIGNVLPDAAMEMIEQIQRKALIQIQSLRSDKISLMKRLNQEMRNHNKQKKMRIVLENHLIQLKQHIEKMGLSSPKIVENIQKHENPEHNIPIMFETFNQNQGPSPFQHNFRHHRHSPTPISNMYIDEQFEGSFKPPLNNRPQTAIPSSRNINFLKNQNERIKQTISQVMGPENFAIKNQLRDQLNGLREKVRGYQKLISNNQNNSGSFKNQLEDLQIQGKNLSQNSQRLMRVKSKPEFGMAYHQGGNMKREDILKEMQLLKKRMQELSQENGSLSMNGRFTFVPTPIKFEHSSNIPRFSPSKYEGIINQMQMATFI